MKINYRRALLFVGMFALSVFASGFTLDGEVADPDLSRIYGKIQIVSHFPDYKVKVVDHFPDLRVQVVEHFPDAAGKWKLVDHFPDYKIQIVEHFEDFKIKYVDHFPGVESP